MDIVIDHPDGTRQSYLYETNATGRITTVFSGAADPANSTSVTDGVKSVSTYNAVGLLLTNASYDIAFGRPGNAHYSLARALRL
jgi:hypothetical protein